MKLGLWTYHLPSFPGPTGSNLVSLPQPDLKVKTFVKIWLFYSIHLTILDKMRTCLRKLKLGIWSYDLISFLGPICPELIFRPQTQNVTVSGSKFFFMLSSINFCMKAALTFKIWIFGKVMNVYFQKTAENPLSGVIPDNKDSWKSCLKKPLLGTLNFKHLWNWLAEFKK